MSNKRKSRAQTTTTKFSKIERGGSGPCGCLIREMSSIILVCVNLIFALTGLFLILAGMVVRDGLNTGIKNPVSDFHNAMKKANSEADLSHFKAAEGLSKMSTVAIVVGSVFLIVGFLGCCGACCRIYSCLMIYTIIVLLMLVAETLFVVLVIVMKDKLEAAFKKPMIDTLQNTYEGFNATDPVSLGLNYAMIKFKCCGVDSYKDFWNATNWKRNFTHPNITELEVYLNVPVACCKLNGTFPKVVIPANLSCAVHPNPKITNIKKGCFKAIIAVVKKSSKFVLILIVLILALQLFMIILAVCLYRN